MFAKTFKATHDFLHNRYLSQYSDRSYAFARTAGMQAKCEATNCGSPLGELVSGCRRYLYAGCPGGYCTWIPEVVASVTFRSPLLRCPSESFDSFSSLPITDGVGLRYGSALAVTIKQLFRPIYSHFVVLIRDCCWRPNSPSIFHSALVEWQWNNEG